MSLAPLRVLGALIVTGIVSASVVIGSYVMPAARFELFFRWIARTWGRGVMWCAGMAPVVHGQGAETRPLIYVCNHQSHLDIPLLLAHLPHVKILAKTELFRIPVFGRALRRARFLEVDRGNRERAFSTMNEAAAQVRKGTSLLIFAEGTRSRDGKIHPFKKGGFYLAAKTQVPLQPLAIRGTRHRLPRGGKGIYPGTVHLAYGTVIPASDDRNHLLRASHDSLVALHRDLPTENRGNKNFA